MHKTRRLKRGFLAFVLVQPRHRPAAALMVEVGYEPLPAVAPLEDAAKDRAPVTRRRTRL
jgi:hypothetical protein